MCVDEGEAVNDYHWSTSVRQLWWEWGEGPQDDNLDGGCDCRMQGMGPTHDLIEKLNGIDVGALCQGLRARADLEVEVGYYAEEARTRAARRPQQLRVLRLVCPDQLAVGSHDVDRLDVLAGPAPSAAVPAHSALEQETSKANGWAVTAPRHKPILAGNRGKSATAPVRLHAPITPPH